MEVTDLRDDDLRLVSTPCPDGKTFCDSTDDYPKELIENILGKQPKEILDHFFPEVPEETKEEDDITLGDIPNPNVHELCDSEIKRGYLPKKAKARTGSFEYIINTEKYKQAVNLEICNSRGENCDIPGYRPPKCKSECIQKYTTFHLVSINQTNLVTKLFRLPTCCSCRLIFDAH